MTTTASSPTPIFDSVVKDLGGFPSGKMPAPAPMTKRQRHRLAPLTEAALVAAGFGPKEEATK